jgi:hypothetical protein
VERAVQVVQQQLEQMVAIQYFLQLHLRAGAGVLEQARLLEDRAGALVMEEQVRQVQQIKVMQVDLM